MNARGSRRALRGPCLAQLCFEYAMDPRDIVDVLAFVIAAGGLCWQILSQRVQLRVKIDLDRSEFATVDVPLNPLGVTETETRTGVRILLGVSTTSVRPNMVTDIKTTAAAPLEPLPSGATISTGIDERSNPVEEGKTLRLVVNWEIPHAWTLPHRLPPGGSA